MRRTAPGSNVWTGRQATLPLEKRSRARFYSICAAAPPAATLAGAGCRVLEPGQPAPHRHLALLAGIDFSGKRLPPELQAQVLSLRWMGQTPPEPRELLEKSPA